LNVVALSNLETPESGFATPAAAAISLAIALMATAVTTAAIGELRLSHADLSRTQADYMLAGVQSQAELGLISTSSNGRLRWSGPGVAEILAEPEASKLDIAHAAQLDDATLAKLGVIDPDRLLPRLATLGDANAAAIAAADASPAWRACARSIVSPYGTAAKLRFAQAASPTGSGPQWRIGEVWRIRVVLADGWVDDRIVRFTGDLNHPAAIVERQLARGKQEGDQCDVLFAAS
jgi:hypothetical protein